MGSVFAIYQTDQFEASTAAKREYHRLQASPQDGKYLAREAPIKSLPLEASPSQICTARSWCNYGRRSSLPGGLWVPIVFVLFDPGPTLREAAQGQRRNSHLPCPNYPSWNTYRPLLRRQADVSSPSRFHVNPPFLTY